MFRYQAFDDKAATFWIKSNCQPVERHFPDGVPHARKIVRVVRDLVVSDEEVTVVFALQLDPVLERSRKVPDVQWSGWADPGGDALPFAYGVSTHRCRIRPVCRASASKAALL